MLAVNIGLAHRYPLWELVEPGFSFSRTAEDRVHQAVIDSIPEEASATVPAFLAPHMTQRDNLHILGYVSPATDYVAFAPARTTGRTRRTPTAGWRSTEEYRPIRRLGSWQVWQHRGAGPPSNSAGLGGKTP